MELRRRGVGVGDPNANTKTGPAPTPPRRSFVKWICIAALVVLVAAGAAVVLLRYPAPLATDAPNEYELVDVTVIEPLRGRQEISLRVSKGKIAASDKKTALKTAIAKFEGMFALPGLIDLHAHLPIANVMRLTDYFALAFLLHGVTTIREAGDADGTAVGALRTALDAHRVPPLGLHSCGPFVIGPTGTKKWSNSVVLESPADADDLAAKLKALGHTCIKSYDDLDAKSIRALSIAGKAHGLEVLGHVPEALTVEEARVPNEQHYYGVPYPEHLRRGDPVSRKVSWGKVDDARLAAVVNASVALKLAHTPTMVATSQLLQFEHYDPVAMDRDPVLSVAPRLYREVVWSPVHGLPFYRHVDAAVLAETRDSLDKKLRLTRMLFEAGVRLRLGTDVQQPFVVPGGSLWQEMELFVRAGVPLEHVWALATTQAGEDLPDRGDGKAGCLRPGCRADVLIFSEDPTQSLSALSSLRAVIVRGELYDVSAIRERLEAWRAWQDHPLIGGVTTWLGKRAMARAMAESK